MERSAFTEVQRNIAADGDARWDGDVGIHCISARGECCRCAGDTSGIIVVIAVEEDSALVCFHYAAVVYQVAKTAWCVGGYGSLCALHCAEGLCVVAFGDGGVGIAGEGPRVAVVGWNCNRGRRKEGVRDDGGCGNVLIARYAGAAA